MASLVVGITAWTCALGGLLAAFFLSDSALRVAPGILIVWILALGGPIAVVLGHAAVGRVKRTGAAGDGVALGGLLLGYLGITTGILVGVTFVAIGRDDPTRSVPATTTISTLATSGESALPEEPSNAPHTPERRLPIDPDAHVESIPATFSGTWQGTAVNQDGASFRVSVAFEEGQRTATARYQPMGCTSVLSLTRGTETRLEMSLSTEAPCTDGTVSVTRNSGGSLDYAWRRPGTPYRYQATLWLA